MATICIAQRRLTQYRVPLFNALRDRLRASGIQLRLLVGQASAAEIAKSDSAVLDWAVPVPTRYVAGLCWQPLGQYVENAELVVVTQENRLLYNHWLLMRARSFKLAFWGHGGNFQSTSPRGFRERFKSWTSRQVDWWFAYTSLSVDRIRRAGFPAERITTLNNSVDTEELRRNYARAMPGDIVRLKRSHDLNGPVGLFIGSLYADKRLPFLIEAAQRIRKAIPNFSLVVIGDGPLADLIIRSTVQYPWIKFVGRKTGFDKALYAAAADLYLNPGLVGLGILDSFCYELPMVTTDCGLHSPEIAYLVPNVNGRITTNDINAYSATVVELLKDEGGLARLKAGCQFSAFQYNLGNMVTNFSEGIQRALGATWL